MSGQPDRTPEERAFDAYLALMGWFFGEDARKQHRFWGGILELYRSSGCRSWLDFYLSEASVVPEEMRPIVSKLLGAELPDEDPPIEQLADLLESMLALIQRIDLPDDPEIQRAFLIHGLEWALLGKAGRTRMWCSMQLETDIYEFIKKAESGDREAFLTLVKLDCTFLASEFGRKFLCEAELSNDLKFRQDLVSALDSAPGFWKLEGGKKNLKDALALQFMSQIGFRDRPYSEWATFLVSRGFERFATEDSVRKACSRYGIIKSYPERDNKK